MRTVVCDIETDGLINYSTGEFPSKVWCIVCKDWENGEVYKFTPANMHEFSTFAKTVQKWIGHNFLLFDAKVLNYHFALGITVEDVWDTLILSRLACPMRDGGHSLDAWGKFFGRKKPTHEDWSQYSEDMLHRCTEDVEINYTLMRYLKREELRGFSKYSMRLEHSVSAVLERRKEYGAYIDKQEVEDLLAKLQQEADEIEESISRHFPPKLVFKRVLVPRFNKSGQMHGTDQRSLSNADKAEINNDGTYSIYERVPFNIRSRPQLVEKMDEAGWKPIERTASGNSWKINEVNLATLPPDAPDSYHRLVRFNMLDNRITVLSGWLDAIGHDKRIHGNILSIGTWTHRMSHSSPQMGNIPAARNEYGKELRSCWKLAPDKQETHLYMGTDLSAIQIRILAHYMEDDSFTQAVHEGKTEDKTDVHNFNVRAAEGAIANRDDAKTTIYALLLGASDFKLGHINGGGAELGAEIRANLFRNIPGFAKVDKMCEAFADRGYFLGLDGRRIALKGKHWALAAMLQEGEATVMKRSIVMIDREVRTRQLDYKLVNVVHDELQGEVLKAHAEAVLELQHNAIRETGEFFELKCPLAAETSFGLNWYDTH